jgi:hypothetical protein
MPPNTTFFTRLMDEGGAMLWGRVTYEMMERHWPAVAPGDEDAPPAMREWAVKLEAEPKYVVSSTRRDFPWANSHRIAGDLCTDMRKLKDGRRWYRCSRRPWGRRGARLGPVLGSCGHPVAHLGVGPSGANRAEKCRRAGGLSTIRIPLSSFARPATWRTTSTT